MVKIAQGVIFLLLIGLKADRRRKPHATYAAPSTNAASAIIPKLAASWPARDSPPADSPALPEPLESGALEDPKPIMVVVSEAVLEPPPTVMSPVVMPPVVIPVSEVPVMTVPLVAAVVGAVAVTLAGVDRMGSVMMLKPVDVICGLGRGMYSVDVPLVARVGCEKVLDSGWMARLGALSAASVEIVVSFMFADDGCECLVGSVEHSVQFIKMFVLLWHSLHHVLQSWRFPRYAPSCIALFTDLSSKK